MNETAFLYFLSAQHCTGGAASAVTRSMAIDTLDRVLLTVDIGQTRQPARMSHHPGDRMSPSRFACMPHNGMRKIAISTGVASPAYTPAHWHFLVPVFYPS